MVRRGNSLAGGALLSCGGGPEGFRWGSLGVALVCFAWAVGLWLHLVERHEHAHDAHHRHEHSPLAPSGEPHAHVHTHARLVHRHPHYPDIHHRHER